MPWRTTDGQQVAPRGEAEMTTLVQGVFEPGNLLGLVRDFTVFGSTDRGLIKILAGYHQFHAVRKAVESTVRAMAPWEGVREDPASYGLPSVAAQGQGDKRAGVIWHTQGSGKSLLMAFYVGQLVRHAALRNPTIVVITDRNDLDDQLFGTFSMCQDLIRQTPIQANSRAELKVALTRPTCRTRRCRRCCSRQRRFRPVGPVGRLRGPQRGRSRMWLLLGRRNFCSTRGNTCPPS